MTPTGPRFAATDPDACAPEQMFRRVMAQIWPEALPIGLAVSGGADSLAMLLLAHAVIPGQFEVATVDHRLREASAGECAFVRRLCDERGIACAILPIAVPDDGNVMAGARAARYAALAEWAKARGLAAIATAHHLDDQAETLLMRLSHASGVAGLAGIRRRGVVPGSNLPLLRPLLDMRRSDCEAVVADAGIAAVQDPSNHDPAYTRVRVRQALRDMDFLDPSGLATSAACLADAEEALVWASDAEWAKVVRAPGELRYRPDAPRAILMRVIDRAVGEWGGNARGQGVARVIDRLARGENANIGGVMIRVRRGEWVFTPEPPRNPHAAPGRSIS